MTRLGVEKFLQQTAGERTRALEAVVARLKAREAELLESRSETIRRLARAIEFRDEMTGSHVERMSRYCRLLARKLELGTERCELIAVASQLHDIGKIAIPDRVLTKPGPLTVEERTLIETHAELGHRMLGGSTEPLLQLAAEIAWTHHERYDGSGYPRGLRGAQIPLEGRIAAVADVFDALMSDRSYRPRLTLPDALVVMQSERGRSFDPDLLDLFLGALDKAIEVGELRGDQISGRERAHVGEVTM